MKEVKYKKWHSWNHKWFADCWDASCTSRATRLFLKTFCDTFWLPLPSTVAFEALEKSFDYINAVKTIGDSKKMNCKNLTVHCISRRKWQSKVTFFVFLLFPITLVVMNICWKKYCISIFSHFFDIDMAQTAEIGNGGRQSPLHHPKSISRGRW